MKGMQRLLKNVRYFGIRAMGNSSVLYHVLRRIESFDELIVQKDTRICIEGFPRSANSFMTLFFAQWNPDAKVAHHLHLPLQVRMAVKYRIPTIVVIRNPLDATVSLLIREKFLSTGVALRTYVQFYRMIEKYRDNLILADFDTCINRPEEIFERANSKFGTTFKNGLLSDELNQRLFSEIDHVNRLNSGEETSTSRPSALREGLKKEITGKVKRHRFYRSADQAYRDLIMDARYKTEIQLGRA